MFCGAHQLVGAKFGLILVTCEKLFRHISRFPARRTDVISIISPVCIQGQRASQSKGFIIRMGQHCQNCFCHFSSYNVYEYFRPSHKKVNFLNDFAGWNQDLQFT